MNKKLWLEKWETLYKEFLNKEHNGDYIQGFLDSGFWANMINSVEYGQYSRMVSDTRIRQAFEKL